MRFLRRRRTMEPPGEGHDSLGVSSVHFVDATGAATGAATDAPAHDAEARAALRRIVDEAVLLQGLTEDILAGIRQRRSLAELAPPGGALVSRFVALRAEVPEPSDRYLRDAARTLRETLDHHALMLSSSLDMLGDLRPERVSAQLDRIDDLGPPAQRLCALQSELGDAR